MRCARWRPWSHYARLLAVRSEHARSFYETEALRGGWSIRQLARQIDAQFYERTALSRNKAKMQCGDHIVVEYDEDVLRSLKEMDDFA